jgi:archaellum component FlaF (FlaF/FlaG flagellin family)
MLRSYFFKTKDEIAETNLENIYEYMNINDIKGSENTIFLGLGKSASLSAKKYDNLNAVARDKEHFTVSKKEYEIYLKKRDEIWNELVDKILNYYINDDTYSALDNLSKSVGQISNYENPTDEIVSNILQKNNYKNVPSYLYDTIINFSNFLRNFPSRYFEVKIKNIVKLNSFLGAAVPIYLKEHATPILLKNGINIISYYDNSNNETKDINLSYALEEIVNKSKEEILFENGGDILLKNNKNNDLIGLHLPVEMAVYVPSTKDANKTIPKKEFEERINIVREYLASLFGGFSSSDIIGGYVFNSNELITENISKVIAFATKDSFNKNKSKLIKQIAKWAKEWSQEAIGFELEGDLFYINQIGEMSNFTKNK